ncbi:hypothetical protein COO91_07075 [Nostoc flagelliforme CCNUN1]|uniref:Uncharacterized protein n=1 Tax=Nostoc flagelliforme CCNUN1 TaxID=2038116 RepID=A0A2K8T008_9NOSO|nr:hypothetical protein COO91_07075 [Nostoc flagelliforme CCNUN1]
MKEFRSQNSEVRKRSTIKMILPSTPNSCTDAINRVSTPNLF